MNSPGLSTFSLKLIAIVCMTIDHIAMLWIGDLDPDLHSVMRFFGRFTFPIIVFLLTEGYFHTRNKGKYAIRLAAFAPISMYPFWMLEGHPWNVMFTLLAGLLLLMGKDECQKRFNVDPKILMIVGIAAALAASYFMRFADWGFPGVLAIYLGGQIRDFRKRSLVIAGILFVGCVIVSYLKGMLDPAGWFFFSGIPASVLVLLFYNGKKGYSGEGLSRYWFYAYYPAHLLVLNLIFRYMEAGI